MTIDRFGVQAVFDRPLGVDEITIMRTVENIILAERSRRNSNDYAKWVQDNPEAQKLLGEARRYAKEEGLIDGD